MTDKKGIQLKSADTSIIENRLRNTTPGDMVTYAELSTLLGRDAVEFCRGNIGSARHALIRESVFFDCVPNEGYRRLNDDEAVTASDSYTKRARKAARRGMVHLQNVQFDKLTDESKRKHQVTAAQLGAIDLFSSGKATKKLEAAVTDSSHKLAIGETLKLFGG